MTLDEKINELKSLNRNLCDLESEYENTQLITWLEDYKQLKALQIKRPTELYAIENITTGEIIFNARGGCYREKEAEWKRKYGGEFYDDEVKACLICAEQHKQLTKYG